MIVRIRFGSGTKIGRKPRKQRRFAVGIAGLLTPAAVLAAVLALWRIAADMNWTGSFAIPAGFFSHWQVWLGLTFVLSMLSFRLLRFSRPPESAAPPAAKPAKPLPTTEPEREKREFARRGASR